MYYVITVGHRLATRSIVPYAYYQKLSHRDKATYRRSDAIEHIALNDPARLNPMVQGLQAALEQDNQRLLRQISQQLLNEITRDLNTSPVHIKVLARRPSDESEELHGLYEPAEHSKDRAVITVWMRTAAKRQLVAFKTFLRTLLHETCHHLDYEWLKLEESFHTEGFFKRESNLFKQLTKVRNMEQQSLELT